MPETMRAVVIEGPGTVQVGDIPAPEPGPGQVRVRVTGCGVCGSNLPLWEGRSWFSYPLEPGAPGHEGWGLIERLGEGVEQLRVGDHVALLSQHAFAELDVAHASEVVLIPNSLAKCRFPGEAVACGVNVIRRAGIIAGQQVAIVGIGFLGAVLVRLATLAGATVTAITRRAFALDIAADLGATHLVPLREPTQTVHDAETANHGEKFDVVIEATGLQMPLDVASHLTRTRGRLVVAGYHQDGRREIDMQLWNWQGIDVVNAHERDPQIYVEGLRQAVTLVESGMLPLDKLVTHVFPLDDAAGAFNAALSRTSGLLKAAIVANG
jgi:2-desacetyl-2-hydroxyethyl bacteriochlorophyllide A dehydrogenase